MNRVMVVVCSLLLMAVADDCIAEAENGLQVYISVDMEGVTGVVSGDQVTEGGADYERFREVVTAETNAAIDGAVDAGATAIVVNESHGGMKNLLIDRLRPIASVISSNLKPFGMAQGITGELDAAIFIGYHAKAGSALGVLAHTGSGAIRDLRVNGRSIGESGMNAYLAGAYGVPVVMISGDQAATAELQAIIPNIVTVEVKQAIGTTAAESLHPEESVRRIRSAAAQGVENRYAIGVAEPLAPATFEVQFNDVALAEIAARLPGIDRVAADTVGYEMSDYVAGYRLFRVLYKHLTVGY